MLKETDAEIVKILKLSVKWKEFKDFCRQRTDCKDCPFLKDHMCSFATTEKIMEKIARVAKEYFDEQAKEEIF